MKLTPVCRKCLPKKASHLIPSKKWGKNVGEIDPYCYIITFTIAFKLYNTNHFFFHPTKDLKNASPVE